VRLWTICEGMADHLLSMKLWLQARRPAAWADPTGHTLCRKASFNSAGDLVI
jgi:hypothetical protein